MTLIKYGKPYIVGAHNWGFLPVEITQRLTNFDKKCLRRAQKNTFRGGFVHFVCIALSTCSYSPHAHLIILNLVSSVSLLISLVPVSSEPAAG